MRWKKIRETESDVDAAQRLLSTFEPSKVKLVGNRLTVNDTEKMQQTAQQMISSVETSGHWNIRYEIRFMKVDLENVAAIDIDWLTEAVFSSADRAGKKVGLSPLMIGSDEFSTEADGQLFMELRETATPFRPLLGAKITESQARQFVVTSLQDARSNIMLAPKVTLFNGQSAQIMDETQHPFVTGVRPIAGTNASALEPIIDVLPEGVRVQIRGDVSEDERLSMQCILTLSEVGEVGLANLPLEQADDQRSLVTVQVPQATSVSLRAASLLQAR